MKVPRCSRASASLSAFRASRSVPKPTFRAVADPIVVEGQRASALPFDSVRAQALLSALVVFHLLPDGFRNADLRALLAPLLGLDPSLMTQGRMSYDLRRLRLHGLIERLPGTHRYTVTTRGFHLAVFLTRVHHRLLRDGLADILDEHAADNALRHELQRLDSVVQQISRKHRLIA